MINPFYMKDRVVWNREMPLGTIRGTRFAVLGAMLLPVALVCLLAGFDIVRYAGAPAWMLSAATWILVVSLLSVNAGIHVYPRERDLGALELATMTPTSPCAEVSGRFRGAFIPIVEAWAMGAVYVLTVPVLLPRPLDCGGPSYDNITADLINVAAASWIFTVFWFASLTALSLYWSARARSSAEALTAVLTSLVVVNVAYTLLAAGGIPNPVVQILPLNPTCLMSLWACADPHIYRDGGIPPYWSLLSIVWMVLGLFVAPLWAAAVSVQLRETARLVEAQVPLQRGPAPEGATGLVPTATPAPRTHGHGRPNQPPLDRGLSTRLLRRFEGNPFYHAYRKGFIRVHAGESAAPGSVMAAATMIVGLVAYRLLTTVDPLVGSAVLLICLTIASVIGACEGLVLGTRALSTERDQSTWPMLVVSGMRPATLLQGKFATAFYALSGEWSIATPFWVLAALSWHPAVALLALVQPAAIALGILFGLWMASQPRYLLISLHSIGLWLCGLLGGLWVIREVVLPNPGGLATLAQTYNPLRMVNNLAGFSTPEGLVQFGAQLALWGFVALVLWNRSDARLQRVLRGE